MALFDGLGLEEIQTGSVAGLATQNVFFTGSVTVGGAVATASTFSAAGITSTAGVSNTGSLVNSASAYYTAGSPYNTGWITIPLAARSNISGGMWVTASGGKAFAGPAAALKPLGVAQSTVASGGTVQVIIKGIVPMVAEGTVAVAGGCEVGAGAALNTVKPHAAGSGAIFSTLDSAGSEGTVFVVL